MLLFYYLKYMSVCLCHCLSLSLCVSLSLSLSLIKRIDSLYRRGIKMISSEKNIPTLIKIQKLNLLPLIEHFTYNSILLTYKIMNNLAPNYLKQYLKYSNRPNSTNFITSMPFARINKFKISFSFAAPLHWNKLPKDIRNISRIGTFKTSLKKYLSKKCFETS